MPWSHGGVAHPQLDLSLRQRGERELALGIRRDGDIGVEVTAPVGHLEIHHPNLGPRDRLTLPVDNASVQTGAWQRHGVQRDLKGPLADWPHDLSEGRTASTQCPRRSHLNPIARAVLGKAQPTVGVRLASPLTHARTLDHINLRTSERATVGQRDDQRKLTPGLRGHPSSVGRDQQGEAEQAGEGHPTLSRHLVDGLFAGRLEIAARFSFAVSTRRYQSEPAAESCADMKATTTREASLPYRRRRRRSDPTTPTTSGVPIAYEASR